MCFKEDNKNFINIKLHAVMRGLSDDEKLENYKTEIQKETRRRLKGSYTECANKLDFYSEAFDELSFFETDYLMLNLFFEKDTNFLFNFLRLNSFNNLNFRDQENVSYKFWDFMSTSSDTDTVSAFLKKELSELLDITDRNWKDKIERNTIIHEYVPWLIKSIQDNLFNGQIISKYLIFCKLWNHSPLYSVQSNAKAIIFYNAINEKFDYLKKNGIYLNLNQLVTNIKEYQYGLLVNNRIYFPLLENQYNNSNGYLAQKNRFTNRLKQSEILCYSFVDKPYHHIFQLMLDNEEDSICNKLFESDILGKLNKFELPDEKEKRKIVNLEMNEEIARYRTGLYSKLYMFEQL